MKLRTRVLDGLYLNWALPAAALPEPPAPLRYERHRWGGGEWVFASAILFRQTGLRLSAVPFVRLSYPQFNLRLYIVDGDGVPSVLFHAMLVPPWVVPAARAVSGQPAGSARFDYPAPSRRTGADHWSWRVHRGSDFAVAARQGSAPPGEGPDLGGWDATVRYFRERDRGYGEVAGGLRRIDTEQPRVAIWPVVAEVVDTALLTELLPLGGAPWPALHSAWLCPEIPFTFEMGVVPRLELSPRMPQAAASSRSSL